MFTSLSSYFFRLDAQVAHQVREFQKRWFLSFLSNRLKMDAAELHKIDIDAEKSALIEIFEKFEMAKTEFVTDLDSQFSEFNNLREIPPGKVMSGLKSVSVLLDTLRLHHLVIEWKVLEDRRREITEPKNHFEKICSTLLYNKGIKVDTENAIRITTDNGGIVPIAKFSSGEKQLLIFLSETLLQQRESHIFVADEPELSLHVEWQMDLVPSLLSINPKAQVIFATHSPDVVGKWQINLTKMEEIAG